MKVETAQLHIRIKASLTHILFLLGFFVAWEYAIRTNPKAQSKLKITFRTPKLISLFLHKVYTSVTTPLCP